MITNHLSSGGLVAWLNGRALVSINEIRPTLRRAGCGIGDRLWTSKPPRFVTSHSGQLSLLPSAGRKMSTGQSAVTFFGWGVKAGIVQSTCG